MDTQEVTALCPPIQDTEDPGDPQVFTMQDCKPKGLTLMIPVTKGGRALTSKSVQCKHPAGCPFNGTVPRLPSALY